MSDEPLTAEPPSSPPTAPFPAFTRPIHTPPGLPWDQQRAAELEARAGSPVTDPMVQIIVRRRAPWRPRRPGLFEAEYLRPQPKVIQPFQTGIRSNWPAWALGQDGRPAPWLPLGGTGLLAVFSFGVAVSVGNLSQAEEARSLAALEAELAETESAMQIAARSVRNAQIIAASGLHDGDLTVALADLAWLSRSRSPEVQVREVEWRRGVTTVRFASARQPFTATDRTISADPSDASGTTWRIEPAAEVAVTSRNTTADADSLAQAPMPGRGS